MGCCTTSNAKGKKTTKKTAKKKIRISSWLCICRGTVSNRSLQSQHYKNIMPFTTIAVGNLETNCYVVWDKESKDTTIIDPGG